MLPAPQFLGSVFFDPGFCGSGVGEGGRMLVSLLFRSIAFALHILFEVPSSKKNSYGYCNSERDREDCQNLP
ncbi:hypothetical protein A3F07_01475 [candidate division WWE3 bacterium RIFCSPHIGHO2_12_FULL_38_15]|nr:MAG: hypothetical protein A3F07_01475 [candidate division WWE3 bacterium RIFCSPHIGHO2_12_FULL_38_15]